MNRYRDRKSQISGIYLPLTTYVTKKQKSASYAVYLSLGTFKRIALGLLGLILLLSPLSAYASVIELVPHVPDPNELAYMNLSISFSNHTKALISNQSLDEARANEAVTILNALIEGRSLEELMTDAMHDLEPLAEEEELEEEEQQQEESSSSSDSSSNGGDSVLIPQPGDDQVFPPNAEPQPFPDDGSGNGSDDEEVEEEESSNNVEVSEE